MFEFKGRGAFVTGGASGMGLGMAKAFARKGARVAIADIRQDHLDAAVAEAAAEGLDLAPFQLDVTDRAGFASAGDAAEATVGPITVLSLNAGIGVLGHIKDASYDDWDWILGVNLGGVINGVRTFVPRIRAHGRRGHVMATASLGGLVVANSGGIYSAAKFGVVTMMQCLRDDLAKEGIGVSVLCPAAVNTNIHEHYDMRPTHFGDSRYSQTQEEADGLKQMLSKGMSPDRVGEIVVEGINENRLYILTHPGAPVVIQRRDALIASVPDEPKNEARWQADLAARRMMNERLA
jgi:NAD(P)-dependent dehydrogenase (short-subunit alcohol dehydrogenase family)